MRRCTSCPLVVTLAGLPSHTRSFHFCTALPSPLLKCTFIGWMAAPPLANVSRLESYRTPVFLESDFNCAALSKVVRSHVAHAAVYASVKSDYRCVSKTNDSLSLKSSSHLKWEERWEGTESRFNMYGHEWYISGYYQNTNKKLGEEQEPRLNVVSLAGSLLWRSTLATR